MPRHAGVLVGLVAVVLYHVANLGSFAPAYRELDIVQIALFSASAW